MLLFTGLRHPPVLDEHRPLTAGERRRGLVALALLVITFVPVPLGVADPATIAELVPGEAVLPPAGAARSPGAAPRR